MSRAGKESRRYPRHAPRRRNHSGGPALVPAFIFSCPVPLPPARFLP